MPKFPNPAWAQQGQRLRSNLSEFPLMLKVAEAQRGKGHTQAPLVNLKLSQEFLSTSGMNPAGKKQAERHKHSQIN